MSSTASIGDTSWRAADLRPRSALAGIQSYYRCALSPDERLVAYAVRPLRYEDAGNAAPELLLLATGALRRLEGAEIWITGLAGGETRVLTPGSAGWGTSWGPCWSPDGRRLAFYSDRHGVPQLWLWGRGSDTTRLACEAAAIIRFGFEGMRWLPDGRRLVAKLRAPGWEPPVAPSEAVPPTPAKGRRDVWVSPPNERAAQRREEGLRWFDLSRGDVAVVDVETGEARRIGTEVVPWGLTVSPDGRYVAALCVRDEEPGERYQLNVGPFDLHLFAVDGSLHRVLAERILQSYGTDCSWSPRSDALAYITLGGELGRPGRLVVVALDGREVAACGGDTLSFGMAEKTAPPLWAADGQTLYGYGERGAVGTVYALDLASGAVRDLGPGLDRSVTGIVFRPGAGTAPDFGRPGTLAVVTVDPHTRRAGLFQLDARGDDAPTPVVPERGGGLRDILLTGDAGGRWIVRPAGDDLYAIDTHTGEDHRLTALNAHLERLPRLTSSLIPMRGLQGEARQAAVWLPAGYEPGRHYPTVVNVYLGRQAGPSANDPEKALLTARGYLMVEPDMPHVSGVDPAEAATRYALTALDAAVAQGLADPERAAVMGHSQGGYNVCCIVTRTDRFRAAVAAAPFADLVSLSLRVAGNQLAGAGTVEGGQVRMGATVWEQRQRYVENSPVFHLDRVTTPLLLLCGTVDSLLAQAEEMYAGLLRLGKVAMLVRYHGEGHVSYSAWSDANFEDYWKRILGWFDRYLVGPRGAE